MSRQGAYRTPTPQNVKAFWESEANEIGSTPQVTVRDHYFRLHELHTLLPLIPSCSRLLDVGCGTGFGTMVLARRARHTVGLDYSEAMIRWAQKLRNDPEYRTQLGREFSPVWGLDTPDDLGSQVEFVQGDILDLNLDCPPFDVITGQRILINLPSSDAQMRALAGLRKWIRPPGMLILTEPTLQGYERTDAYRARFGLPKLEKYWHNIYLDESRLQEWSSVGWCIHQNLGFGTYTLLSKVIYPASCGHESCQFLSGANAAAMELASLARTKVAVEEMGLGSFLELYIHRVQHYDAASATVIAAWVEKNASLLTDWNSIGHQRLVIAHAA